MKILFFAATFICFIKTSFTQTNSLVGSWYWEDSTTTTSVFFKPDGSVQMHSGPKGEAILTNNLKDGKYKLKKNQLTIKWRDSKVERKYLKFLNKNTLQITFIDKQNMNQKRALVFRKVFDEEVKDE